MNEINNKKYNRKLHEEFDKILSHNSVRGEAEPNMPFGKGVFDTLISALDCAEDLGLQSVNLHGYAGYAEIGEGEETVAVLTHLDVVPEGEGWLTDPFKPVRKDGKIFARGTVDNKCAAAAALVALAAIKDSDIPLKCKLRVIFGCDEESGFSDIEHYLKHEKQPDYAIVPDSHFPIVNGEKGLMHMSLTANRKPCDEPLAILSLDGGSVANIVPNRATAELRAPFDKISALVENYAIGLPAKYTCEPTKEGVRITCEGVASHGSAPEQGVNALAYLVAFLGTIPLAPGDAEKFMYAISDKIGLEYDGARLGIAANEEVSGMLTLNLGTLHVCPDEVQAKIDIRYPMCVDGQAVIEKITKDFAAKNVKAEIIQHKKPHFIGEDSPLVVALKKAYEDCFNEPARCEIGAGATYARAFDHGVAFGPVTAERTVVEHAPNEFIYEEELEKLMEVLMSAMIIMAKQG